MSKLLAQGVQIGNFNSIGPLGNIPQVGPATNSFVKFENMISAILGFMTIVGSLWFIFQIFIGSINWLSAGSDKQAVENAKKRLQNAFVGLLLVVLSYSLIAIVGQFLGIDILDLQLLLSRLGP